MDKPLLLRPEGLAWGLGGWAGLGAMAYMLPPLMRRLKGKMMTDLESAMLNLLVPLIDMLRAIEKERDAEKEKARSLMEEGIELTKQNKDLQAEIKSMQIAADAGAGQVQALQLALVELRGERDALVLLTASAKRKARGAGAA